MDWVTCPKCGFTQIPTEKCLRCGRPSAPSDRETVATFSDRDPPTVLLPRGQPRSQPAAEAVRTVAIDRPAGVPGARPEGSSSPVSPAPIASAASPLPRRRPRWPVPAAIAGAIAILAVAYLATRGPASAPTSPVSPTPAPASGPAALDLSGRWETEFSKTLPGPPARPVLKQVFIDTDREGNILAAGVLLTDPGRGGAGAGYRLATDGPQRLGEVASALAAAPAGAALPQVDFIPFPAWMPTRDRVWRALEGQSRRLIDVRYVLLESIEDDYVVQAGINRSGFLSYAFFSKQYGRNRGVDALSGVIHPDPGSSLGGFKNLVWDLSGAADFLTLEVSATLSGPEGSMDRLTLTRAATGAPKSNP